MGKKCFYKVLGVGRDASDESIKLVYRALAQKYHPDRNPGDRSVEAKFKEVREAYDILSDPKLRAEYDHELDRIAAEAEMIRGMGRKKTSEGVAKRHTEYGKDMRAGDRAVDQTLEILNEKLDKVNEYGHWFGKSGRWVSFIIACSFILFGVFAGFPPATLLGLILVGVAVLAWMTKSNLPYTIGLGVYVAFLILNKIAGE